MSESPSILINVLPEFEKRSRKLFSTEELVGLKDLLAAHPGSGVVIPGTGGVRKLRWRSKGKGKRGGARVIYFYYLNAYTIYLLTAFGKNQKEDLSVEEKRLWTEVVEAITSKKREPK